MPAFPCRRGNEQAVSEADDADEEADAQDEGPLDGELSGPVGDRACVEREDGAGEERADSREVGFEPSREAQVVDLDRLGDPGEMARELVQVKGGHIVLGY